MRTGLAYGRAAGYGSGRGAGECGCRASATAEGGLTGLRWQVVEAGGGAEAMAQVELGQAGGAGAGWLAAGPGGG